MREDLSINMMAHTDILFNDHKFTVELNHHIRAGGRGKFRDFTHLSPLFTTCVPLFTCFTGGYHYWVTCGTRYTSACHLELSGCPVAVVHLPRSNWAWGGAIHMYLWVSGMETQKWQCESEWSCMAWQLQQTKLWNVKWSHACHTVHTLSRGAEPAGQEWYFTGLRPCMLSTLSVCG